VIFIVLTFHVGQTLNWADGGWCSLNLTFAAAGAPPGSYTCRTFDVYRLVIRKMSLFHGFYTKVAGLV
jgi:hypothetical protein